MPRNNETATTFTLASLNELDFGKIPAAFTAEMKHAVADCKDRPMETKARKVSISFILVPKIDKQSNDNHADEVEMQCEVTSTVPKRKTNVYTMRTKQDHGLLFEPDSPTEPNQPGLYPKGHPLNEDDE